MRADDFDTAWPFDTEEAHALRAQLIELEEQRLAAVQAQRPLRQQLLDERVAMASNLDSLVRDALTELMDLYRAALGEHGMAWEGLLEASVLHLRAHDMHKAHQAKGTPWCWIGGLRQIEWTAPGDIGRKYSPLVTPRMVQDQCERVGFIGNAWASDSNGLGVSLVVTSLVEPREGACTVTR